MPAVTPRLSDLTLTQLENLLTLNPGVLTFPALNFPIDAAASGVTIPNPTNVTGLNTVSTLQGGVKIQGGAYQNNIPVVTRAQILNAFTTLRDVVNSSTGVPPPYTVPDQSTLSLSGKISTVNAPSNGASSTSVQVPTNAVAVTQASNPGLAISPVLYTDTLVPEGVLNVNLVPAPYKQHIQVTQDVVNSA
jgi:hypothetical protein